MELNRDDDLFSLFLLSGGDPVPGSESGSVPKTFSNHFFCGYVSAMVNGHKMRMEMRTSKNISMGLSLCNG